MASLCPGRYDPACYPQGLLKPSWGVEVAGPEEKVELGSWGSLSLWQSGRCVPEPEHLTSKLFFVQYGLPLC